MFKIEFFIGLQTTYSLSIFQRSSLQYQLNAEWLLCQEYGVHSEKNFVEIL